MCRGAVVGRCEAFGIGEAHRAGRNLDDAFAVYLNGYRMRDLIRDGLCCCNSVDSIVAAWLPAC